MKGVVMGRPRILLVGSGSMGSLHARVIAQSDRCDLAGIVDTNPERGQEMADKYQTSWMPTMDFHGIDAVMVAVPTEAHYAIATQVLDAGLPLFVEKPLTPDITLCRNLVSASAKKGLPLMCGLLERYNPAIITAMRLIGEPHLFRSVRHSPYAPRIKTGVAWDLLIHDVDLAVRMLPGTARDSHAVVGVFDARSSLGAEDVAEVSLVMDSGSIASVSASRLSQRKIRIVTVYELDRMIEMDLLRRNVTVYRNVSIEAYGPTGQDYRQQEIIEIPELVTSREPLASQLDHFLDILAGTADMEAERMSILPAHEVVSAALASRSA